MHVNVTLDSLWHHQCGVLFGDERFDVSAEDLKVDWVLEVLFLVFQFHVDVAVLFYDLLRRLLVRRLLIAALMNIKASNELECIILRYTSFFYKQSLIWNSASARIAGTWFSASSVLSVLLKEIYCTICIVLHMTQWKIRKTNLPIIILVDF